VVLLAKGAGGVGTDGTVVLLAKGGGWVGTTVVLLGTPVEIIVNGGGEIVVTF
jgi:hypothetical protein